MKKTYPLLLLFLFTLSAQAFSHPGHRRADRSCSGNRVERIYHDYYHNAPRYRYPRHRHPNRRYRPDNCGRRYDRAHRRHMRRVRYCRNNPYDYRCYIHPYYRRF